MVQKITEFCFLNIHRCISAGFTLPEAFLFSLDCKREERNQTEVAQRQMDS